MTLIDEMEHERKIKLRRDRIEHNHNEINRLLDQNYILNNEVTELEKLK